MKKESISTKTMLLNIASMPNGARHLLNQNKSYSALLKYILTLNFYYGDGKIPSLKELAKTNGVSNNKVRKYIEDIYNDLILNENFRPKFTFSKVRYKFLVRGYRKEKFIGVEVEQLPKIPRVGEEITLPFFSGYLGTSSFFVESVSYDFEEDCQTVSVWLRAGSYNSYWHYRKDKAREENEISIFDWLQLDEPELKKKLKIGNWS